MSRHLVAVLFLFVVVAPAIAAADSVPDAPPGLQTSLDGWFDELVEKDPALRKQKVRVSVLDMPVEGPATLAHINGDSPVYPASVVKFVYLMAAYEWRDQGLLEIDAAFDRQLTAMIYRSSNRATQVVLRRLTETEAGPRLGDADYADFKERRHRVKRWLQRLGISDLHTVHPTYDGGSDLFGRDEQFLEDRTVEGALPYQGGPYRNRQAMTANGTVGLLALLATDKALAPESSAEVRERMRRDVRKQPYLTHRIAGGADGRKDLEVFSKTGTWGPITADAGIVRHRSGHQLVVAAYIEGTPRYRGGFIARITRRAVKHLLPPLTGK